MNLFKMSLLLFTIFCGTARADTFDIDAGVFFSVCNPDCVGPTSNSWVQHHTLNFSSNPLILPLGENTAGGDHLYASLIINRYSYGISICASIQKNQEPADIGSCVLVDDFSEINTVFSGATKYIVGGTTILPSVVFSHHFPF